MKFRKEDVAFLMRISQATLMRLVNADKFPAPGGRDKSGLWWASDAVMPSIAEYRRG